MISKYKYAVAVIGLGVAVVSTAASAQPLKIAVVNSSEVVQKSPQYRAAEKEIKKEFGKRQDKLKSESQKLQKDIQNYQKNSDVMTSDNRVKKENELLARENDLKYERKQFEQDLQKREHQLEQKMMGEIKDVIDQIAKKQGYTLVLRDPVYAVPSMDITHEVLKRLKSETKQH